ncbi:MAG: CDP-glycerol glycerophosphotransferase family protein [Bdellovibrionota bacterium]
MLLYIITGVASALFYSIKYKFKDFTIAIKNLLNRQSDFEFSNDVVVHIEGPQYWNTFSSIIEHLNGTELNVICVSYGEMPPANLEKNVRFKIFRSQEESIFYMNKIEAKIVLSTTPQLDVYSLKKSSKVGVYAYVFHAPTDVAFYEKHALDHYDLVFCVGEYHKKSIRKLEAVRNSKTKDLLEGGCPYYDNYKQSLVSRNSNEKLTILYAPSWGARNSLKKFGIVILEQLLEGDFDIVLRPHPQSYVSEADFMDEVLSFCVSSPRIKIDKNINIAESIKESDLLLSDISGVIFDYAFLAGKPIVLFEMGIDVSGYEAEDLDEIWELNIRKKIALEIQECDVFNLNERIRTYIASYKQEDNLMVAQSEIFNFKNSGKIIAEKVLDLLN